MKNNQLRITILSVLSYLGPLCFVPLMNRDSEFVHLHAKQGLVIWALSNILIAIIIIPIIGINIVKLLILVLFLYSILGITSVLLNKSINLIGITYLSKLI